MNQWSIRAIYGALIAELVLVVVFAATYNALDFKIYAWGGQAVFHDARLYLAQAYGHWFTYPPFAAVSFAPFARLPLVLARVLWDLASVGAFAISCVITLDLADRRMPRPTIVGVVAAGMLLEPVYHTLFLGQVNLILLALILADCWRASRGRAAGIGVGIAAAIKLTPAIFAVFFLVTRRTAAALTALATFAVCGLIAYLVAPAASRMYWQHLFYDTSRVGAPYISNQSPYATSIRIAGGAAQVGGWYVVIPVVIAIVGLATAAILARNGDWLAGAAVTGVAGLEISPISWTHHWVWIMPALIVLLVRGGRRERVAAACGYALFVVAPMWFTPHSGGPREYGFHWLGTLLANCFTIAGLAFLGYMAGCAYLTVRGNAPGDRVGSDQRQIADDALGVTAPAQYGHVRFRIAGPDRRGRA